MLVVISVAAGVHILATSRVRLSIEGEAPVPLSGLSQNQAFDLFVDRVRRTAPGFTLDAGDEQSAADELSSRHGATCSTPISLPLHSSCICAVQTVFRALQTVVKVRTERYLGNESHLALNALK